VILLGALLRRGYDHRVRPASKRAVETWDEETTGTTYSVVFAEG
jgi:hypothetical protein